MHHGSQISKVPAVPNSFVLASQVNLVYIGSNTHIIKTQRITPALINIGTNHHEREPAAAQCLVLQPEMHCRPT